MLEELSGGLRKAAALQAPFPYWGGKRKAAAEVWKRLGPCHSYIEPFGGSLAVLLACPYGARPREVVNDIDGFIPNFYRALRDDPDQVAYYADWPTSHLDLVARKKYCLTLLPSLADRLASDEAYYDAKVAGYWVWCVSNDIGLFKERCDPEEQEDERCMPCVSPVTGGKGVSAMRSMPHVSEGASRSGVQGAMPHVSEYSSGRGVASGVQKVGGMPYVCVNAGYRGVATNRRNMPHVPPDAGGVGVTAQAGGPKAAEPAGMPRVCAYAGGQGGNAQAGPKVVNRIPFVTSKNGVQADRAGTEGVPFSGERLLEYFYDLANRLARTYILCKDWQTLCSPSVMGLTPHSIPKGEPHICGIFLDPPYATPGRSTIYGNDDLDVAHAVKAWAIDKAATPHVRIALAGYADDYDAFPDGWTQYVWQTHQGRMGAESKGEYDRTEVIWFSPGCLTPESTAQGNFFDLVETG